MSRIAVIAAVAMILASMTSCFNFSRPHKEVYYYHVNYEAPEYNGTPVQNVIVRLGAFNAASSFQSLKIVYSTSSYRRKTYDYHHWLVTPADMVSELLQRDIASSKLYSAVVSVRSSLAPQYEIEGTIEEIMEKDDGETWFSVITLRCAAFALPEKFGKKHVLFQKAYKESVPTEKKSPGGVVAAMSQAMKNISLRIQKDLNKAILEHEASKAKGEY